MHRLADEPQADLLHRPVSLEEIAPKAGRDDVGPRGLPAPRARYDVVHGQLLPAPAAVLAGVPVAAEDVLLVERDPLEERLADVGGEPYHRGQREGARGGADHARRRLDALGLAGEKKRHRTPGVREMQRLVRIVEHQDRYVIHIRSSRIVSAPRPVNSGRSDQRPPERRRNPRQQQEGGHEPAPVPQDERQQRAENDEAKPVEADLSTIGPGALAD